MIRQNELMNVRCSERGSLLGIKIYSPSSECLIECVDIPEHCSINHSNRSISVRLLFLFCSRVFMSRSHENRSNEVSILSGCP